MAFMDLTGNTYNRLTVIEEVLPRTGGSKWLCKCTCGNTKVVRAASIKNGSCKSCGCLHIEANKSMFTKHGEYKCKLYAVHQAMIRRCTTKTNKVYPLYGGRGIAVHPTWFDYATFKEWATSAGYKEGLTLDRIDTNGSYSPENCHWVDSMYQARNRRALKCKSSNYIGVHWDSSRQKWMASIGISNKTISLGRFLLEEDAAKARDKYINDQNLSGFVLNFP